MIMRKKRLPKQDWNAILRHADRFTRAQAALAEWAPIAKKCVEYFENIQWSETDLALLKEQGRPALTINKIYPLVKLVYGYFLNNRVDIKYLPGHDGTGTDDLARVLTHVSKQISEISHLPYIDGDVFMDALLTGRGFYDCRLDFEKNDFGEVKYRAVDPFSVYLDPDAQEYDLNSGNFLMTSRNVSLDEVEYHYGRDAAGLVAPLIDGKVTWGNMPFGSMGDGMAEITPWRGFGGEIDGNPAWGNLGAQFHDWVDPYRKTVRMLEIQHYVPTERWYWVDLDTGDKEPIADSASHEQVQAVLETCQSQGIQLIAQRRQCRRPRITHMIGDVMVYDDWSIYESFSIVGLFPYFRRGKTMGMVERLLSPQDEINRERSLRMDIQGRTANGGWMVEEGSLDAQNKANLEMNGSTPGVVVTYKTGKTVPQQIRQEVQPVSQTQLERDSERDLKEIAGVNSDALGQVEKVQSGRAIEAKQRQTLVAQEDFMSNYSRTKELCGGKQLEIVQRHYREQRIIRAIGDNGKPQSIMINQRTAQQIVNNVMAGKYAVAVDESPLSTTFMQETFERLLDLKREGVPIPDEFIIDSMQVGRKEELKQALAQQRAAEAAQAQAEAMNGNGRGPGPGGSAVGPDGGSMPNGEPGQPVPV